MSGDDLMLEERVTATVLRLLGEIAPEADIRGLKPEVTFHDQFGIDSVDFLNLVTALQVEFQVRIPEEDFPMLASLNGCIGYLSPRINATGGTGA